LRPEVPHSIVLRSILAAMAFLLLPAEGALAGPKVVILGFDGADARLVEQYMAEGKLPNLQRLREQGSYAPSPRRILRRRPSPGRRSPRDQPGKTGIFDF